MTKWPLLIIVVFLISPSLIVAQTAQTGDPSFPVEEHMPAKKAHIVSFHVSTDGTLHIIYSDKAEVWISKERGRFTDRSGEILTQEAFSDIQMADDHQHIGWLADYMICAQSYPCSPELVIYQSGHKLTYIRPSYGVMWRWKFLSGGKQVVAQFGFPHGDVTGTYALYDTKTGRELARFSSEEEEAAEGPDWVQQLQRSKR